MTTRRIDDDLKSLVGYAADAKGKPLPLPKVRAAMPAVSAVARKSGAAKSGVSSPITEPDIAQRTVYSGKYYKSPDGLFLMPAIHLVKSSDSSGEPFDQNYATPP